MSDAEEEVLEGEENQAPVEHVVQEEEAEPVVETHDDEKEMLIFNKILAGAFDDSIPPTKRKLVRIFTSSTFTDTLVERNMLMEKIYPRLKTYCKEYHGLEFQVVDMRWGVRDESTDEHKTADLCMTEIDGCQRLSLGPNFVTFLCQKYGYRPLQNRIIDTEFNMFCEVSAKDDEELLRKWYWLDTNTIPDTYILMKISTYYKHFCNKAQKALMEQDQGLWWKTMAQLNIIIRKASKKLMEQKRWSAWDDHRYNFSVTEQEVIKGIIMVPENVETTFAFIRKINNINIPLFAHSCKYIDINFAERKVDQEAIDMLADLRDKRVPEKLVADSIIHWNLEWSDNEGINAVEHADYLVKFGETFYSRLVDLIQKAINKLMKITNNKLYAETLQHCHFCRNFVRLFKGREKLLESSKRYILDPSRIHPFIMHGPSGSGKSSVIARVAVMAKALIESTTVQPVIVIRFLGTTPNSSSIFPLLTSLCEQISHNYEKPFDQIPMELSNLTNYFKKLLESATPEKPLFIFLDSLDQLSSSNSAHSLSWMPVNLPENCKFIVTCLDGYYGIMETFHNMIETEEQFELVEPMGEQLGLIAIQEMLSSISRCINAEQTQFVQNVLKSCNEALYAKLVFDQIRLWRSFTTELAIKTTINEMIGDTFGRVENAHGKVLVGAAMAYVTASKSGLSEVEVEDLISIDETVLNDIYQYHLPPVRRIPPLLWTRIRSEIPAYLSEREADGVTVVSWYHRQFIHVANERYLFDPSFKLYIHSQIADYFTAKWAYGPKPFQYTPDQMRMFRLRSPHGEADRKVPEMPEIYYSTVDNSEKYNGRKLSELPYHLIRSKRVDELFKLVLFHYKFLYAKLCCNPLNNVIADFEDFLENFKYHKEVILIADALRLSSSILSISATNLVPQLVGRLLPYYFINSKKFANVKRLIEECESDGLNNSVLVPAFNCFMVPGGPLKFSLEGHPFAIYGMHLMAGGTQLFSVSNRFMVFDLSSGDLMRVINPGIEGIMQSLSVSGDNKYCVSFSNTDAIIVCNVISGDVKILRRYTTAMPEPEVPPEPEPPKKKKGKPPAPLTKTQIAAKKAAEAKAAIELEAARAAYKDYSDTLLGNHASYAYFVVYSKFFIYVYDKKTRFVKAIRLEVPVIQVEIIENQSIIDYGIELEIITRDRDIRDDEEVERENLILYYMPVVDSDLVKGQKKEEKREEEVKREEGENGEGVNEERIEPKKEELVDERPTEEEVLQQYVASANKIECHSCIKATKNKKKLFTFTEINDNVVEVFRSRTVKTSKGKTKNLWKYFGSLDENKEVISQLVLSDDEQYMLGCMSTGFKVYYLMTGQSKPLKLPAGVKNINIGYKKMTFTAVFSKENKYVVAGVKDNIYIWETSYGIFIKTLDAHYGRISKMLHNVNGLNNLVISGSMDKTIKIWNIQNILEEDFPLDHLDKQIEMLHVSVQAGIAMAQSRNQLVVISLKNGRIKYPLCNSPHGAIFTCSALNNTGTIAASSESNKLVVWDVEQKTTTFVSSTQSKTIPIMQLQFHQSDQYVLCAYLDQTHKVVSLTNYMLPDGDIVYTEEIQIKTVNDYKPFMLTSDDMYLVFFRDDKKGDMLAVHMAADGSLQHNIKLSYPNFTANFSAIVPFYESPFMVAIIDNEKGNIINCRDKKFIRSIKNWNGKMTRDDKFGLYAPGRGGLEFLDLKSALRAKVFIPKVAEGVFDVDTLITPNDMHIIYYHSGKRTIRVYRISDCKKVADYKSAAKVRTMICTQDSRALVFGCEDGTVNMMIIADPLDEESVANLRAWRADQMTLYARDVPDSPTAEDEDNELFKEEEKPVEEKASDTAAAPADGGEAIPSEGGEVIPSEGGEVIPSEGGEVIPSEGGEVIPSEGGEVISSEGGEVLPSNEIQAGSEGVESAASNLLDVTAEDMQIGKEASSTNEAQDNENKQEEKDDDEDVIIPNSENTMNDM